MQEKRFTVKSFFITFVRMLKKKRLDKQSHGQPLPDPSKAYFTFFLNNNLIVKKNAIYEKKK